MKHGKKLILLLMIAAICIFTTACSTTAFSNAEIYRNEVGAVMKTWFPSGSTAEAKGDQESAKAKLATPADFTLDADGSYSFGGVENADYYLMYFCSTDATDDKDAFLFSSESIPATGNGEETYSGNVNDLISYGYGEYLVKVFAFPSMNDNRNAMSSAATAAYSCSGVMEDPVIDYLWNTFEDTVDVQVSNIGNYMYQVYPDSVVVTFTNVEDAADTVEVTIDALSADHYSTQCADLTPGATYDVKAVGHSASAFATNAETNTVDVAQGVTFGEHNVISKNYYYTDGIARKSFSYPQVTEKLDVTTGGTLNSDNSSVSFTFTATPIAANAGSTYSFIVAADCRFSFDDAPLELYTDGTFKLSQLGEMPPEGPSSIEGIWTDNGDGTVTLSYNHATLWTSVDG